jgi:hypothetical protein
LVLASDSSAVSEALVLLLDQKRTEVARTASTASGGFLLVAPGPGTYWLRVQRIGFQAWETNSPPLAAGGSWTPVLAIPEVPYALPELMAYGGKSLCGVALGNADVMAKLLEAAQTTLGLAEAGFSGEERKFKVQTWRHTVRADGTPLDSTPSLAPRQLSGWPIKSADPESLRAWGFERGTWPDPRKVVPGPIAVPVFYCPAQPVPFTAPSLRRAAGRAPDRGARAARAGAADPVRAARTARAAMPTRDRAGRRDESRRRRPPGCASRSRRVRSSRTCCERSRR